MAIRKRRTSDPDVTTHNRWWRDHGFQEKPHPQRQGAFNPPETTFYVPYDRRHDFALEDEVEIDGKKWSVIGVTFRPEDDQASVTAIEAGYLERYNREIRERRNRHSNGIVFR
jgi:hypothetical protein